MDLTTEIEAFFDSHPRRKTKALLLDLTLVIPFVSSNLENAARHPEKYVADAVERKKNMYRSMLVPRYLLLPLVMSMCDEVDPDVHTLIKELTISRVKHRLEIHPDKSRYLSSVVIFLCFYSRYLLPSTRDNISAERESRLQVANSSIRKARWL